MDKKTESLEFARSVENVSLGTVESNQPHIRIMEVARIDNDFCVWFTTSASSKKIGQVRRNPNVCIVFNSGFRDLKIIGKAEIIEDKDAKHELYKEKWDRYYPKGGKNDPDYAVIKITPDLVEYRDMEKYGLTPKKVI